jgi:hypothetical protein
MDSLRFCCIPSIPIYPCVCVCVYRRNSHGSTDVDLAVHSRSIVRVPVPIIHPLNNEIGIDGDVCSIVTKNDTVGE